MFRTSADMHQYADDYQSLSLNGTDCLVFRDLPYLIKAYVKGCSTLDYGCGVGRSTLFLKSLGMYVSGVDTNAHMINNAKQADPTIDYKIIESGEIPFEDNSYDLVFSSWVLQEVGRKEELGKITKEIARVLKPNGTLIIVTSNENHYKFDWLSYNTKFEANKVLKSGGVVKVHFKENNLILDDYFWTHDDYCELVAEAGLTVVHSHEPLGKDTDGLAWISETTCSPFTVFVATKC